MKKQWLFYMVVAVLLAALPLLAACAAEEEAPSLPANVVLSVKADSAPVLDGQSEALWSKAAAITIPVSGGDIRMGSGLWSGDASLLLVASTMSSMLT